MAALNINTDLGINAQSNIFTPKTADIVKGDELARVAREILSAPARKQAAVNAADVKIYTQGADVNQVKQVATNINGFNVVLSPDTLTAINNLKAYAAQTQAQNITRLVDGKFQPNIDKANIPEFKSVFSADKNYGLQVLNSSGTDKDKKGSGGFYVPLIKDEEEGKKEGINLVI